MYYVSHETFKKLSPEVQEEVMAETKKMVTGDEGEEMEGVKDPMASKKEPMPPTPGEGGMEGKDGEGRNYPRSEDELRDDMPDDEKNKIKDFDEAGDKGLAIMIGMGKPKKKAEKPIEDDKEGM